MRESFEYALTLQNYPDSIMLNINAKYIYRIFSGFITTLLYII